MESFANNSMESRWVYLQVRHWLKFFLYTFKRVGYKSDFNSHYYRWKVYNFFVLFTSPEHLKAFRNFLNGPHANMSFTIENVVLFTHTLIDATEYAPVGLNYTLN